MKRIIKASNDAQKVDDIIEFLLDEGCDEHEIFMYFVDSMLPEDAIKVLKNFAEMSDVDLFGMYDD